MGNSDSSMVRRDFKLNPVTMEEEVQCIWYAVPNDLIGGWSVSNVDKPASQINVYHSQFELGTFMDRRVAEHIVNLHNKWWNRYVDDTYADNIMTTWNREMEEFYDAEAYRKSVDKDFDLE